jgi:hypothetical protein
MALYLLFAKQVPGANFFSSFFKESRAIVYIWNGRTFSRRVHQMLRLIAPAF